MARNNNMVKSIQYYWGMWELLQETRKIPLGLSPWDRGVYSSILTRAPEYMKKHIETFYIDTIGVEYYPIKQ